MPRVIIIPVRLRETRFNGKAMHRFIKHSRIPMVEHIYRLAQKTSAKDVIIAGCDKRIRSLCTRKRFHYARTSIQEPTGTHRCGSLIKHCIDLYGKDVRIINWHCDEPMVQPEDIDRMFDELDRVRFGVFTFVRQFRDEEEIHNPDVVKVVVSYAGLRPRCLWFGRYPLPGALAHTGVYGYTPGALKLLGKLRPTGRAATERLEQLAWLEYGIDIYSLQLDHSLKSVKTLDDLIELDQSNYR